MNRPITPKYHVKLSELINRKMFVLPLSMANEVDPETSKKVLKVAINGKKTFIPVGEPTEIDFNYFCLLKDIGVIPKDQSFGGIEFDPVRNET